MCLLTAHFVKLKSVIFLLCNLEAISSNFIPVKFSGHTVHTYMGTFIVCYALWILSHMWGLLPLYIVCYVLWVLPYPWVLLPLYVIMLCAACFVLVGTLPFYVTVACACGFFTVCCLLHLCLTAPLPPYSYNGCCVLYIIYRMLCTAVWFVPVGHHNLISCVLILYVVYCTPMGTTSALYCMLCIAALYMCLWTLPPISLYTVCFRFVSCAAVICFLPACGHCHDFVSYVAYCCMVFTCGCACVWSNTVQLKKHILKCIYKI